MWLITVNAYVAFAMMHSTYAFLEQSVHVKGRLLCGSQPAPSVLVKLVDRDHGNEASDLLNSHNPKAKCIS